MASIEQNRKLMMEQIKSLRSLSDAADKLSMVYQLKSKDRHNVGLNESIFKNSKNQTKKYTLKSGETITLKVDKFMRSYGSLNITAFDDDDNKIGAAYFTSDETNNSKILSASDTSVKPKWRRKGVGTAIYDFAKTLKYKIIPSKEQTLDGKKFTNSLK